MATSRRHSINENSIVFSVDSIDEEIARNKTAKCATDDDNCVVGISDDYCVINLEHTTFLKKLSANIEQIIDDVDIEIGRKTERQMDVREKFPDRIVVPSITQADYSKVLLQVREVWKQFRDMPETQQSESLYVICASIDTPLERRHIHCNIVASDGESTDKSILRKLVEMMVTTAIEQLRIQYEDYVVLPIKYENASDTSAASILRCAWWQDAASEFVNKVRLKNIDREIASYCFKRWILRTDKRNRDAWMTMLRGHDEITKVRLMNARNLVWTREYEEERRWVARTYHGICGKRPRCGEVYRDAKIANNSSLETDEESDVPDNAERTTRRLKRVATALESLTDAL